MRVEYKAFWLRIDRPRDNLPQGQEIVKGGGLGIRVDGRRIMDVPADLTAFPVARCTVARLMREMGLAGVIRGKPVRMTISDKAAPCPLDHVNRRFYAPAPNMLWVSDFTYGAPRAHMTGMQRERRN